VDESREIISKNFEKICSFDFLRNMLHIESVGVSIEGEERSRYNIKALHSSLSLQLIIVEMLVLLKINSKVLFLETRLPII
jgi:hypothetical protein